MMLHWQCGLGSSSRSRTSCWPRTCQRTRATQGRCPRTAACTVGVLDWCLRAVLRAGAHSCPVCSCPCVLSHPKGSIRLPHPESLASRSSVAFTDCLLLIVLVPGSNPARCYLAGAVCAVWCQYISIGILKGLAMRCRLNILAGDIFTSFAALGGMHPSCAVRRLPIEMSMCTWLCAGAGPGAE